MEDSIFIVTQESNVDGTILFNATPCIDYDTAKAVMNKEIDTLLTESRKYMGLNLDDLEKRTEDEEDWDCDFNVERTEDHIYITCNVDDYYEKIDIEEKQIVRA